MNEPSKSLKFLGGDVVAFWMMATLSLCVGLLLNQFRDRRLPLAYQSKQERLEEEVSSLIVVEATERKAAFHSPQKLSLEEFRAFVKEGQGVVLDARPEIFHRLGHAPGALSLPREDFEKSYAGLKDKMDKNQPIVVYCSSNSCEDSELIQKALVSLGYTHVAVFRGGWAEWTQAGLPEEKTP